ncbi:uncharacterized protein LOC112269957 isoform X2 [Brachypodium distachyon]|uniref:uncharacterized protein LOC112269957 isoform X2 n=1 Tax=Brachypodium distachyon TaxID=15368 RepID=UPI000D0E1142|nr:uncharacterized protein LOC112269957 isoform X2 [Brachypodium distachyon]|eukprot:XP_024313296.1 uncharacterized protein LOC112269957 isoform X2 [Brachypodium distachyon]
MLLAGPLSIAGDRRAGGPMWRSRAHRRRRCRPSSAPNARVSGLTSAGGGGGGRRRRPLGIYLTPVTFLRSCLDQKLEANQGVH